MGQKVNPTGIRLGIVRKHNSVWYADSKNYAKNLITDLRARSYIEQRLANASVSRVVIERLAQTARIVVHTARPGIVIGKKGEDVDRLRKDLTRRMGVPVQINIEEVRKPDLDAKLLAQGVAQQLERRIMFRRAMKRVVQSAMRAGAEGVKVQVSGRLGGAEIARTEWYREGRVPLHTLRADIDYATTRRSPPTVSSVSRCGCSRARSSAGRPKHRRRPPVRSRETIARAESDVAAEAYQVS
jgi:small subunit ribosomal protein S3